MTPRSPVVVVVVAFAGDVHERLLTAELLSRGHAVHVIQLGLEANEYEVALGPGTADLRSNETTVSLETASRAHLLFLEFDVSNPRWVVAENDFVAREWASALGSVFMSWNDVNPVGWLIGPEALLLQDRKPYLLMGADQACPHVRIPNWCVTQRLGVGAKQRVRKSINAWQEYEPGRYINTARLTRVFEENFAGELLPAPLLLQDLAQHEVELRLYIAGERYAGVWQSYAVQSEVDLRLSNAISARSASGFVKDDLRFYELSLFLKSIGLRYAAFDFAVRGDELLLLDINPVGTWGFLEGVTDLNISRIIIEGLIT